MPTRAPGCSRSRARRSGNSRRGAIRRRIFPRGSTANRPMSRRPSRRALAQIGDGRQGQVAAGVRRQRKSRQQRPPDPASALAGDAGLDAARQSRPRAQRSFPERSHPAAPGGQRRGFPGRRQDRKPGALRPPASSCCATAFSPPSASCNSRPASTRSAFRDSLTERGSHSYELLVEAEGRHARGEQRVAGRGGSEGTAESSAALVRTGEPAFSRAACCACRVSP